jgi:hypothetical protein
LSRFNSSLKNPAKSNITFFFLFVFWLGLCISCKSPTSRC